MASITTPMFSSAVREKIIDWFLPPLCVHCRREGAWFCFEAEAELAALVPITTSEPGFPVITLGSYDRPVLGSLVRQLKYHGWHGLASALPGVMEPLRLALVDQPPPVVIVPVPLHSRRWRERGFNQAEIIARALAGRTNWPIKKYLKRRRYTQAQARLAHDERKANIEAAFDMAPRAINPAGSIILVDDVVTTGATMRACARVLRSHGLRNIAGVALAKG